MLQANKFFVASCSIFIVYAGVMNQGENMSEFIDFYINHCPSCKEYLGVESKRQGECYECYAEFNRKQHRHAQDNPSIYERDVKLFNGEICKVIEMADRFIDGKIIEVFGLFAVTDRGIECLNHEYFIDNSRLNKPDWVLHMSAKTWVVSADFEAALDFAKQLARNS